MKRIPLLLIAFLSLLTFLLIFENCGSSEEEPEPNKPPIVSITNPTDNAIITIGETVQINVSAADPDGSIGNVTIYINNVEEDSFNAPPYSVSVNTADADAGQYTIKAVAKDNLGLTATDQITVTLAESNPPTVTTSDITDITETTASGGGNVTDDGGNDITARGVVWGEASGPTLESNSGKTVDGSGIGAFTSSITGLTKNTTYYVKAYATNSQGTAYGAEKSFQTPGSLPTVITGFVTDITHESAKCGGEVTEDAGNAITAKGIVWSDTYDVTLDNAIGSTDEGPGLGSFVSTMTGLTPNTTYYVRAYATNSEGTSYGDPEVNFTTGTYVGPPTVKTLEVSYIGAHAALSGVEFVDNGGGNSGEIGIVWGASPNPDINNNDGIYTSTSWSGGPSPIEFVFEIPVTSLDPETTYYVRAYGRNNNGAGYGEEKSFTTLAFSQIVQTGTFTDTRDNTVYNTTTINGQTWMAENLTYLPEVCAYDASCGYWVYDYTGTDVATAKANPNYTTYGVLYNWEMAKASCPTGWHLPTHEEWAILEMNLGMNFDDATYEDYQDRGTNEGNKIKETGTEHWIDDSGATNESEFTALPGGWRYSGGFQNLGVFGYFWSSDQFWPGGVPLRYLASSSELIYLIRAADPNSGYSVRCVQD